MGDHKVYVTGSRGLIGRAILHGLSGLGIEVLSDENCVGKRINLENERLVDLLPRDFTCVVHCAAVIPHRVGVADDEQLQKRNFLIDSNVQEFTNALSIPVAYISGCGLYDRKTTESQDETSKLIPRTPYFSSKMVGEKLFSIDARSSILRVSAPFGDGMPQSVVLQRFLDQARLGDPVRLWGSGKREQDYISVNDISTAVHRVLTQRQSGIFNIAAGNPLTMKEVANIVAHQFGTTVVHSEHEDPNEFERVRVSIAKARHLLKWEPKESLSTWVKRYQARLGLREGESGVNQ